MVSASIEIAIHPVEVSRITQVDFNHIPFGKIFSDHMFVADYYDGAWQKAEIVPYGKIGFSPAISGLHYGQSVFEGMKAYKTVTGEVVSFRQENNFSRINKSAVRLCMPEIPRDIFIGGLEALLKLDKNWIPETEGSSLYIRPI
jgi:branched-chain amino acid aminotransferase